MSGVCWKDPSTGLQVCYYLEDKPDNTKTVPKWAKGSYAGNQATNSKQGVSG